MASCEVEPLDLSMDAMHNGYDDQDFDKMTASEDMREKMEELAKEMSHFSYKDLWTECCRRYKDIVKRLLGYEVHSNLIKDSIVLEPGDGDRCRKRKASDGSNDSGVCEDSALPLKKRHLRTEYLGNDEVFESNKEGASEDKVVMETRCTDHDVAALSQMGAVGCYVNTHCAPESEPSHHHYGCCAPPEEQADDLPCDLSTHHSPLHQLSTIPSLSKYDNSQVNIRSMSHEQSRGLLAKLLTEPQPIPAILQGYPPRQLLTEQKCENTAKVSNAQDHTNVPEGQLRHPNLDTSYQAIYASPYLSTSNDFGRYAHPSRQYLIAPRHTPTNKTDHFRGYSAHRSTNAASLHNSTSVDQASHKLHSRDPDNAENGTTVNKPKVHNVRENCRDKVLKRLLQYRSNPNDETINLKLYKTKDNEDLEGESEKSYWGLIEQACVKMAFM